AYDDGDFFRGVVGGELRFSSGLACGEDGEVRGAVGRDDDAGVDVLARIEVFNGGRLAEAEALGAGGRVGGGGGGADARGPVGGRATEVRDGVADGCDATQAGYDDTIHAAPPGDSIFSYKSRVRIEYCLRGGRSWR